MYLEHFHLTHSPFREEPDPEVFFPGAKREEICQSLVLDILAGKSLIKLIGREGSGKTLICRLITARLPTDFEVIYIDNPAGAFDDLLRLACLDLGMNPITVHGPADFLHEFKAFVQQRRNERRRVVIIIDEAEKLFLATLERFVRYIVEHGQDSGLTILLSGRPGLEANLEQLAAFCTPAEIGTGYYLESLSENETRQYLRFRLYAAGLSREQHEDIFTEGAVAKIFDTAKGNLRMINILAEEALQVSYTEKSFLVLLDHVDPEAVERDSMEGRVVELYDMLRHNRLMAGLFVTTVVLVLSVGYWLSGHDRVASPPHRQQPLPPLEVVTPSSSPTASTTTLSSAVQTAEPQTSPSVSSPTSLPSTGTEPQPSETQANGAVVNKSPQAEPTTSSPSASPAVMAQQKQNLTPGQRQLQTALNKDNEQRDGEKLFRDRRGASASWLAGAYRGGYTIQLMMLASDRAQASLANMLVQDDYFPFRDQFFILSKKGSQPTFFVFYGIYSSMDAAREARNSMPVFLRKHHPYPLSIDEALKKTEN